MRRLQDPYRCSKGSFWRFWWANLLSATHWSTHLHTESYSTLVSKNIAERKYPITMKIVYLWWNLPAAYPARTGKRSATTHLQKKWSHFTKSSALKPGDTMCCPTFASDNWPLETNVAKQDQRSRKCVITVYTSRGKERNKREWYTCVWVQK